MPWNPAGVAGGNGGALNGGGYANGYGDGQGKDSSVTLNLTASGPPYAAVFDGLFRATCKANQDTGLPLSVAKLSWFVSSRPACAQQAAAEKAALTQNVQPVSATEVGGIFTFQARGGAPSSWTYGDAERKHPVAWGVR